MQNTFVDPKAYVEQVLKTNPDYFERIECDLKPWTEPFKCAVVTCKNSFQMYDLTNPLPYKFHDFPSDLDLRALWIEKCGLQYDSNVDSIKVCSDHFLFEQYDRNYREEFKNPDYRRPLKHTAIPTEKLGLLIPIIIEDDNLDLDEIKAEVEKNENLKTKLAEQTNEEINLMKLINALDKKNKIKRARIHKIKRQTAFFKRKDYKQTRNILSRVYSDAQINILRGDKKTYWSEDDLAKAFTIRHMSSKFCYLYLKNTLNYPLPALSCVQKWAASK